MLCHNLLANLYYWTLDQLPSKLALKIQGFRELHYWMDLENPQTLNEKINWRKLYQRDPRFDVLSDKQDVKDYITKKVGIEHVVPTLWCGANFDEIPWETFTYPIVIKCTHSTGDVFFIYSRETLNINTIRKHFQKFWDNRKLKRYSRSTHESKNKRYIIEPMITVNRKAPEDYKYYCFHGKVHFVTVDEDRFGKHTRRFYDHNWSPLDVVFDFPHKRDPLGPARQQPGKHPDMLLIAEKLSQEFDFVRIDLYCVEGQIYCGELTFTPGAGLSPFVPKSWDFSFGKLWQIPSNNSSDSLPSALRTHL